MLIQILFVQNTEKFTQIMQRDLHFEKNETTEWSVMMPRVVLLLIVNTIYLPFHIPTSLTYTDTSCQKPITPLDPIDIASTEIAGHRYR